MGEPDMQQSSPATLEPGMLWLCGPALTNKLPVCSNCIVFMMVHMKVCVCEKKTEAYLVVWGHDEPAWGSGGRDNSHFLQRRALGVAIVRVASVPCPICVVVSLLLLLVFLQVKKKHIWTLSVL